MWRAGAEPRSFSRSVAPDWAFITPLAGSSLAPPRRFEAKSYEIESRSEQPLYIRTFYRAQRAGHTDDRWLVGIRSRSCPAVLRAACYPNSEGGRRA